MKTETHKINEPRKCVTTIAALTNKPAFEEQAMASAILLRVLRDVKSYIACVGYSACDNSFAVWGAA